MLYSVDRDLTLEEKENLFKKVNDVVFPDYDYWIDRKDIVQKYLPNVYDNDILSMMFDYVSRKQKLDPHRHYHEKGRMSEVSKFALKNKENLFRIQLIAAVMGSSKAATDIGTIYRYNGDKEKAWKWYKKVLLKYRENCEETVRGILLMTILKHNHYFGVI